MNTVPRSALTREDMDNVIALTPFSRWAQSRILQYDRGWVRIETAIRSEMMHQGRTHGAIVGYMADIACAWSAASEAGDVVTAEYKINFLERAGRSLLRAEGRVLKTDTRQVVSRAEVYSIRNGQSSLVAVALATIARV